MTISSVGAAAFQTIHIDPALSPILKATAESVAVWGICVVPLCWALLWFSTSRSSRSTAIVAGLAATSSLTMAGLPSWTFYFPRPFSEGLAQNVLHPVADSSFPSDHVAVLAAVFFATLLGRRLGASILLGFGLIGLAWARIALGIHFPSDVLGALVAGAIVGAAVQGQATGTLCAVRPAGRRDDCGTGAMHPRGP